MQSQQQPQQVSIPIQPQPADPRITGAHIGGFFVGYFTWIFGAFLCFAGGDGRRTKALRTGIGLGMIAGTVALGALIAFFFVVPRLRYGYYY